MAQVIFHIGMGKTGTTTIQNALKRIRQNCQHRESSILGNGLGSCTRISMATMDFRGSSASRRKNL